MRLRFAALCAPALLAGSAVGHAVGGGPGAGGTAIVAVGDGPAAVATGFSVSAGRVVTVAHVLGGATVTVRGTDGVAHRGAVIRRDDVLDLALLAVPGLHAAAAPAQPGTQLLVRRGGGVATLPARVLRHISARVRRAGSSVVAVRPALELAATIAAGDSGAPVLRDGRVAGIVFARSHDRAGVVYAVDAGVLARLTG
jgi:S1-C subfamily serine protease